jgi:hypothetical protein
MSDTLLAEARMPEQRITELAEQMTSSGRPYGGCLTSYVVYVKNKNKNF